MRRILLFSFSLLLLLTPAVAQQLPAPKVYVLSGLEVEGTKYVDPNGIKNLSGLTVGSSVRIPGSDISDAIKRLWQKDLFSNVSIRQDNVVGKNIFLTIEVTERARISRFSFQGINKTQADELKEKINFISGTILTDAKKQTAKRVIRNYYVEKGFYNTTVEIEELPDEILRNGVVVNINVDRLSLIHI